MSKLREPQTLPLSAKLQPSWFSFYINGDEFFSHLQIGFNKHVNIHKRGMNSAGAGGSDFKRTQGWRTKCEWKLQREMHTGTGELRSIYWIYTGISIFMTFQQKLQKKKNATKLITMQPSSPSPIIQPPLSLRFVCPSRLWSFLWLCCEPAQPRGEVTFSINRHYRKLILSSREHTDTHSLRIDWNPARSGSLTERQHQSWYSPALRRNPYERKSFRRGGE